MTFKQLDVPVFSNFCMLSTAASVNVNTSWTRGLLPRDTTMEVRPLVSPTETDRFLCDRVGISGCGYQMRVRTVRQPDADLLLIFPYRHCKNCTSSFGRWKFKLRYVNPVRILTQRNYFRITIAILEMAVVVGMVLGDSFATRNRWKITSPTSTKFSMLSKSCFRIESSVFENRGENYFQFTVAIWDYDGWRRTCARPG